MESHLFSLLFDVLLLSTFIDGVLIYSHLCMNLFVCMYVCMYVYMYACMYVCMYICIYVY